MIITRRATLFGIIYKSLITSMENGNISQETLSDIKDVLDRIVEDLRYLDNTRFLYDQKYEWKGE